MRAISTPLAWILAVTIAGVAGGPADALTTLAATDGLEHEVIVALAREHRGSAGDGLLEALATVIYREAVNADVDPLLVASIVAKESAFLPRAVSCTGALGLMQLAPWVARDLSIRTDVEWTGAGSLASPEVNVRLGILYYKEMVRRFDGDAQKALTAYNAGPTRVARQLRDGTYRPSRYAREVLDLHSRLLEKS